MTSRAGAPTGSPVSVLVVEDDSSFRDIIAHALEATGYVALTAFSASDALSLAASNVTIDLLPADVVMPDMSGPELAVRIHDERPDLPVVFMSGYAERDLHEQGLIPRGTPALHEPFDLAELRSWTDASVHAVARVQRGQG